MRFYGLALVTSAAVLGACGGGENKATDTTKAPPAAAATTPAPAPSTAAPAAAANATAKVAATGATHDIKMIGDDKGYRFEPAAVTIKSGDAVRFTMVSGGPHNVAFDPATIPADQKGQLDANMGSEKMGELSSALKTNAGESVTVSFANIKPGKYPFHCTPHLALGMKGEITVQ